MYVEDASYCENQRSIYVQATVERNITSILISL